MIGHVGGGALSKCLKTPYYKNLLETIFVNINLQWHVSEL